MKLSLTLSAALFATSIVAFPSTLAERSARRRSARSARSHGSQPLIALGTATKENAINGNETAHVQYSSNWSGAVLTSPPSGQTFNAVSGSFNVPAATQGTGSESSWSASAWVGIDGDTYDNAILQSGCDFTVSSSGADSYDCWYEWYPDYAYDFSDFTPSAGDEIAVSIVASSSSKGTVKLTNQSTGQSVSKTLTAPSSSSTLGGQNAEWIVEDFEENGSLVPLADFQTVTFTNCVAKTASESVGLSGATVIEIEQSGTVLTDVTVESSSEVQIVYV
ncbi:putative aspergillopepsin-2 precursor [Lepidopterella palustris CBS 459.81]|uniref:Putative aspergillopepsin-2 n=1 Tax=Lepidopterella palustris CBS 459.81 TaxID=1314670 RepID=A0A8E2ECL0_9PEZI|nr:putative aspergillopepsin-2 precursor [Lepidopterella palustris CBS 459.81]